MWKYTCLDCKSTWSAHEMLTCHECGSTNVEQGEMVYPF